MLVYNSIAEHSSLGELNLLKTIKRQETDPFKENSNFKDLDSSLSRGLNETCQTAIPATTLGLKLISVGPKENVVLIQPAPLDYLSHVTVSQ